MRPRRHSLAACLLLLLVVAPAARAGAGRNRHARVSRPSGFGPLATPFTNDSDTTAGGDHLVADVDGQRYVAFVSRADGLSAADVDTVANVYVRDRVLGVTTLVSRAGGPAGANGTSSEPWISSDGRWVAFESLATNLASGTGDGNSHIYLRDLAGGDDAARRPCRGANGAVEQRRGVRAGGDGHGRQGIRSWRSRASRPTSTARPAASGRSATASRRVDTTMVSRPDGSPRSPATRARATCRSPPTASRSRSSRWPPTCVSGEWTRTPPTTCSSEPSANATDVASGIAADGDSQPALDQRQRQFVAFCSRPRTSRWRTTATHRARRLRDAAERRLRDRPRRARPRRAGTLGDAALGAAVDRRRRQRRRVPSSSTNLVAGDANDTADVFVRSGVFAGAVATTAMLSRPADGSRRPTAASRTPRIARRVTGQRWSRLVVFATGADDMGPADDNDFLAGLRPLGRPRRRAEPGDILLFAAGRGGPVPQRGQSAPSVAARRSLGRELARSMSADGRYTVFRSRTPNDLSRASTPTGSPTSSAATT